VKAVYKNIKIGKLDIFFFLYERDELGPTGLIGGGIHWGFYDTCITGETSTGF